MSTITSFQRELERQPVDLARAALRFAQAIAYPELDIGEYVNHLDRLAGALAPRLAPAWSPSERAEALADYLFTELEFQGNTGDYYDPRNSYLNNVLERRIGIPISLSAVYLALAERLVIPAQGIGLPGHFIISVADPQGTIYLDPFHGGTRLSREDCRQLVSASTGYQGSLQEEWLQSIPTRAILTRMLNNLQRIYFQQENWMAALAVLEHLRLLQPDLPELVRDQGIAYHRQDSLHEAVEAYEAYLSQAPQAPDAAAVRAHLRAAARKLARLN